jgi:hypothetical protein
MTHSSCYKTSAVFHNFIYPSILGIAMFCMLLLNADALISLADRSKKYFSKKGYGLFLKFEYEELEDVFKV